MSLAPSLSPTSFAAGIICRCRWQIELFFKWLKTMLPCGHWIAESPEGVAIQTYAAMVASPLLTLWAGNRPTKRQMEALRLHWMGFVSKEELARALGLEKINNPRSGGFNLGPFRVELCLSAPTPV